VDGLARALFGVLGRRAKFVEAHQRPPRLDTHLVSDLCSTQQSMIARARLRNTDKHKHTRARAHTHTEYAVQTGLCLKNTEACFAAAPPSTLSIASSIALCRAVPAPRLSLYLAEHPILAHLTRGARAIHVDFVPDQRLERHIGVRLALGLEAASRPRLRGCRAVESAGTRAARGQREWGRVRACPGGYMCGMCTCQPPSSRL
jgi:hypothetical protein